MTDWHPGPRWTAGDWICAILLAAGLAYLWWAGFEALTNWPTFPAEGPAREDWG